MMMMMMLPAACGTDDDDDGDDAHGTSPATLCTPGHCHTKNLRNLIDDDQKWSKTKKHRGRTGDRGGKQENGRGDGKWKNLKKLRRERILRDLDHFSPTLLIRNVAVDSASGMASSGCPSTSSLSTEG